MLRNVVLFISSASLATTVTPGIFSFLSDMYVCQLLIAFLIHRVLTQFGGVSTLRVLPLELVGSAEAMTTLGVVLIAVVLQVAGPLITTIGTVLLLAGRILHSYAVLCMEDMM